jgi:hypothetical protein
MILRRFKLIVYALSLLLSLIFVHGLNIPHVKAFPDIFQGDLILNGNNVTTIEGRFDINGSIFVEANATLILNNAVVNFTSNDGIFFQNPANGNPRLRATNVTIIDMTYSRYYGNGSILFINSSVEGYLFFYDESNVTFLDSEISQYVSVRDSPRVTFSNSTVEQLQLVTHSANSSISHLSPGFFDYWDFWLNGSVTVSSGSAPNITLIQTAVQEWSLSFQSSSSAEIFSSDISQLHANGIAHISVTNSTIDSVELYSSSIAELANSTHTTSRLFNEAKIFVSWYLNVHVLDSIGQDVPLANVTASYPNSTLAESKLTGVDAWVRLTLMEKMVNITGEYAVGNYTVEATFEVYSDEATVNMTGNQQAILTLESFIIPEFTSLIILPLFMTLTLLVAFLYNRKRFH